MKNKVLTALIGLTLTLSMVLGILVGCGTPATPTATVTPTAKPTATATAKPTTASSPTPKKTGEVFKWRLQTGISAGSPNWWVQKEFCENVRIATGGRLNLELFPNGAIVGRTEFVDAVGTGAIEMAWHDSNDYVGKETEFMMGNIVAGMEHMVQLEWFTYRNPTGAGGFPEVTVPPGQELFDRLYGQYKIKAIYMGTNAREVLYMANKKILLPADYKGSIFRTSGWEGNVVAEFGGKSVTMPSADVYSALQTGVIDATQAGGASSNVASGYQDITKYWGFPGMHNLGQNSHIQINMDNWNELPEDIQKILEMVCGYTRLVHTAFTDVQDAMMVPFLAEKGINTVYIAPETQQMWRDAMLKTGNEQFSKDDPQFKESWDKAMEFQYMMDAYFDLQHPVYSEDYPGRKENAFDSFIFK